MLAGLLLWAVAPAARRLVASPTLQLALACLAFNAVLHYFYRGHGQRFIFAIHVVFPLTVVLAELLAASRVGWRRPLTAVLALSVVLTAGANATFVGRTNELLAVRCVAEGGQGLPICIRWEDGRDGSLVPEP